VTTLILASASATRARLLTCAGIAFQVVPAHVDEAAVKQALLAEKADARRIADVLAEWKALKISRAHPSALVIGCDQVLAFGNELVSKCASMAEARALLMRLRGKKHELISAAVLAKAGAPIWRHVEKASLWMRDFSDDFLDDYLAAEGENLLAGVGCYRIEGKGLQLFSRVEGDNSCIQGLPMLPLLTALRDQGALAP
jgi:septum formation protein